MGKKESSKLFFSLGKASNKAADDSTADYTLLRHLVTGEVDFQVAMINKGFQKWLIGRKVVACGNCAY